VWDNASYHKSKKIEEMLTKHGHTIIYLPPYSPELNPIENLWATLKQRLRCNWDNSLGLVDNLIREMNGMTSLVVG
jgi:transposase